MCLNFELLSIKQMNKTVEISTNNAQSSSNELWTLAGSFLCLKALQWGWGFLDHDYESLFALFYSLNLLFKVQDASDRCRGLLTITSSKTFFLSWKLRSRVQIPQRSSHINVCLIRMKKGKECPSWSFSSMSAFLIDSLLVEDLHFKILKIFF